MACTSWGSCGSAAKPTALPSRIFAAFLKKLLLSDKIRRNVIGISGNILSAQMSFHGWSWPSDNVKNDQNSRRKSTE